MRACVVIFPGSNADAEMIHTLRNVLQVPTETVWHKESSLPEGCDLVAIPGGFSFGDYLRCGAIAKVSPIAGAIREHAAAGKLVLGVCNGFQILTELGLLPGALTQNTHQRFECRDVVLQAEGEGPFTQGIDARLQIPIAHTDGRYQCDSETLARLEGEGRIAFRYVDADGQVLPAANPNGSLANIAGVYGGPNKNVMGMMPHPERRSDAALGQADGKRIFDAALASFQAA